LPSSTPNDLKRLAYKMTTDFPTAPSAYGLNGPSATVTVEKSIHASHTEILTPPDNAPENLSLLKKIVLNILRTDTSGRKKTSLRLRRKRAAWDDDLRAQLLGLNPL